MGKNKEFKEVYENYWSQLYTYAYNILRNKENAEDIIQEVYVDIWNRWDSLEISSTEAYLFKAIKYQCAKRLKQTKFNEVQVEKIEYVLSYLELEEQKKIDTKSLVKTIDLKAKEILPEKCYNIYKLRYHDHLSYKQIAKKLNISLSTVDNQLYKAKGLLQASNINYETILTISVLLIRVI